MSLPEHHDVNNVLSNGHVRRLRTYYEDTWFDYRFLWLDPRTRAMHFGYDHGSGTSHADSLLKLNTVMAERVGLAPEEQVLDAGCGVGGTSFWLAEQWEADVVGINVVADHIERARRYVTERGLDDRPRFELLDYTDTRFEPSSFDVVWATESACHAPDKPPFATEAARLLGPGGRLVMAEYLTTEGYGSHPEVERWEQCWEMTLRSEAHWREVLDDAGFTDIEVVDITPHMRSSLKRLDRLCRLLGPVARLLHLARIRSPAQQRNIVGSRAMWNALGDGAWFYGIIVARQPADDRSTGVGE